MSLSAKTQMFLLRVSKKLDEAAFLSDEERANFKAKNKELVEQIVNRHLQSLNSSFHSGRKHLTSGKALLNMLRARIIIII